MKMIMQEIDRLEEKCTEVKRVREVVRQLKARVDAAGDRIDRMSTSHHSSHGGGHNARHDQRRR